MEYTHKPKYIAAMVTADITFVVTMVFNGLAAGAPGGVFTNSTSATAKIYSTDITPAAWTFFTVWCMIYVWQAVWLVYGLSTVWRRTSYGYLYIAPGHMHPSIYLVFTFNLATNIGWLLLWDRQQNHWSLVMLILTAISLYVCLGISWMRLHARGAVLRREGYAYEVWLVRGLVQNGLGIYAAWVTFMSLINLDVTLHYDGGVSERTSSSICLALLLLVIVSWFFLDNFLTDRYTRYTLTPYPLFIFALVGSLVQNWDIKKSNSVLTALLLATACLAAILKVVLMFLRHMRRRSVFRDVSFFSSQSVYGSTAGDKVLFSTDKDFT